MAAPSLWVSLLGLLTAGLNLARAFQRRVATLTPRQRAIKAAHAAREASAKGDVGAVNALAEQNRLDSTLVVPLVVSLLLLAGCGCGLTRARVNREMAPDPVPEVVVVAADRFQYFTTNEMGVAGWFVPLAVHTEMMEAVALVSYYRSTYTKTPVTAKTTTTIQNSRKAD